MIHIYLKTYEIRWFALKHKKGNAVKSTGCKCENSIITEDGLVWERRIDRKRHLFRMYYMLGGTQEAIDFSIN